MRRGIFITGTDTGVGKTFIAAGIASALRGRGINVGVMKPIHTGCGIRKGAPIPEDSVTLARSASVADSLELITPYSFREPAAPCIVAIKNNVAIDPERIIKAFHKLCAVHDYLIIEGIGGVLVPITWNFYVADLIKRLHFPALIVIRAGLGTINHTMLTIDCLKKRKIPIEGIVINYSRKEKEGLSEKTLPGTIERLSGIRVLGITPYIPQGRRPGHNSLLAITEKLF